MRKHFFFLLLFLLVATLGFSRKPKAKLKARPFVSLYCQCWGSPTWYYAYIDGQLYTGWISAQYTYMAANGYTCETAALTGNIYPYGNVWYFQDGVLVNTVYIDSGMSNYLSCGDFT